MASPNHYRFSVEFLARSSGATRPRVLRALRSSGGDPAAALARLGVDPLEADALAFAARMQGSDQGGRNYFAEYQARLARGRRLGARTAREAAGHPGPEPREPRSMPGIFEGVGWAEVHEVTDAEARRLGRYGARVGELVTGQLSPARFRRLIASWAPLRWERLEATPGVAIAIVEARREAGEDLFPYQGRRG